MQARSKPLSSSTAKQLATCGLLVLALISVDSSQADPLIAATDGTQVRSDVSDEEELLVLVDVNSQHLDETIPVLRSASGYIAAPRGGNLAGASQFEKVMILPVSRGPVGMASTPPPTQFGRPPATMQQMPVPIADDDDPVEQPQVVVPPGMGPQNQPTASPFQAQPGQQQAPMTAPRPGILPAPPPGQPNPYGPPGAPTAPGSPVPTPFIRPGGPGGPPGGPPGQHL